MSFLETLPERGNLVIDNYFERKLARVRFPKGFGAVLIKRLFSKNHCGIFSKFIKLWLADGKRSSYYMIIINIIYYLC
jgi:hypothetical protein